MKPHNGGLRNWCDTAPLSYSDYGCRTDIFCNSCKIK
jgi:hypothetical protein